MGGRSGVIKKILLILVNTVCWIRRKTDKGRRCFVGKSGRMGHRYRK